MPKEYLFVSCDIVAHSTEPNLDLQTERVVAINRIVEATLRRFSNSEIIWASGGDGGHVAFPMETPPTATLELMIELRQWSMQNRVALRISANSGAANDTLGADGRQQLVGPGINLAGRLLPFGGQSRVIVTGDFRERLSKSSAASIQFHDRRLIQPKSFGAQEVWLLSVDGKFVSEWRDGHVSSDRALLQAALQRDDGLEIIHRARRLLEVNPADPEAMSALRVLALKRIRLSNKDSFINDVFIDEQFGPEVIRSGTLIERRAQEILCEYNDEGDTMFLILKGQVGVFLPDHDSAGPAEPPKLGFIMRSGELAGEIAFALRRKRTATLRCLEDASLLAFSYEEILRPYAESSQRRQLEETLNRKILARVVENIWNTAPYLRDMAESGPLTKLAAPWLSLLQYSSLTPMTWNRRELKSAHPAFAPGSLCILISGRVQTQPGGTVLDGIDYPILFADIPEEIESRRESYALLEDIKLLTIHADGLRRLGPAAYREVVQRMKNVLRPPLAPSEPPPERRVTDKIVVGKKHVFLSYCRDNLAEVRQLHADLLAAGEKVWWDQNLLGGQDWKLEIHKALKSAYTVVLCLSKETEARSTSGIFPEALDAIGILREQTPGSVFLIPVRLSECEVPPLEINAIARLDQIQNVDLFPESKRADNLRRLLQAIQAAPNHP